MTFTTKISLTDDKKARDIFFSFQQKITLIFVQQKFQQENFSPYCFDKLHVDIHSRDFFLYPDITNSREYFITWKCFTQINYISPQERYNVYNDVSASNDKIRLVTIVSLS